MRKIFNRLITQSVILLLFFSVIIALVFGVLFAKQTEDMHQEEMINRAELISKTMEDFFKLETKDSQDRGGKSGGMGGYGAFIRFLNQIAGEEVWVLNKQMEPIIEDHHKDITRKDPPAGTQTLLTKTYQTKQTQIEKKRAFVQLQDLTVTTPIKSDGVVKGVVVMHSKVTAIHKNQLSGYLMLVISLLAAVVIASLLAWRLAKRFVQPIYTMKSYVDDLANEKFDTELKLNTHDELEELGNQLSILSQRLLTARQEQEKKKQAEKDFLSQISHELRTPVMVIKSSLATIKAGYVDNDDEKKYLDQLIVEANGLERLVTDLLELSRLESTEFQLQKEPIDLLDCIEDAMRSYRVAIKDKQQTTEFENSLTERRLIEGDYFRMTQLFKILLDNANKYAPAKSLITISVKEKGRDLEISVTNSQTVANVDTEKFFDSFQRGKQLTEDGTGLGLAIAKQVVVRHNGQIHAESIDKKFIIKIILPCLS
ncbi:HAMP domain-containing histidine kinase [Enterococcus raffinosus]|uniref:sensor histidine kinase n=1 Tax=Enterococcus raffinosus TaxID=71452 RepID=UPI000E2868FC|nr:HAMP domain-containing sensor histidine kinase [Enterococcus raffinosus]MBU5362040.1 HAMP domain-containing histidine kinase [Enterococcus raffinosus]REC32573.1 two-component sensor histidine kinase [Enterococcus pseudoavium]